MGNFSVSHYTRLEAASKGVEVTYVLDLAEVPAYTLLRDWGLDAKSPRLSSNKRLRSRLGPGRKGWSFIPREHQSSRSS